MYDSRDFGQHAHTFGQDAQQAGEKRTLWVIGLTFVTMVVELLAGHYTGSMALSADGWHMSTHVAALGIAAFTYNFARKHAQNRRFTFGTGKVGTLGGFASAIALAMISILLAWESAQRLLNPITVHFQEAIVVAFVGLLVNIISAWLLSGGDDHHHGHAHHHNHPHDGHENNHGQDRDNTKHKDFNLRAAYLHVLADALTSITALVALTCGMYLGWAWMDPLMGIVGSLVIAVWSYGLLRDSGQVLLDAEEHGKRMESIRTLLKHVDDDAKIIDLHIWRVGMANHACIISLLTHNPQPLNTYKRALEGVSGLDHITVEINHARAD